MKCRNFILPMLWMLVISGLAIAQQRLPRPEPPFRGQIGRTAKESKPDFPKAVQAPKGPPISCSS